MRPPQISEIVTPANRYVQGGRVLLAGLALWLLLNEGELPSLVVGAPAAIIGVALSQHLPAPARNRISIKGLFEFISYFLWQALVGGWDVARRALGPRVRVAPGFLGYHLSLPAGLPRAVFLDTLTLLPGTLSADVEGAELRMHVVDVGACSPAQIQELEQRVARLFRIEDIRK